MDSSPSASSKTPAPSLPSTGGVKRPASSLLPAFEPLSSSPGLPRPAKRQATTDAYLKYPTPVPTSSTGILSSSPPRVAGSRPALQRTLSVASERAPLSAVPSVDLNENGDVLLMGRSSNSSHYQLSANRLISRVHVKARFIPTSQPLEPSKVEIVCNGWNGLKLHCQGRTWELAKGDTFTSETEGAEIMIDVQDARVLINWPRRENRGDALSDSSWDESPRTRAPGAPGASGILNGSPLRRARRISSPESPSPANASTSNTNLHDLMPSGSGGVPVQIYEDASADEHDDLPKLTAADAKGASMVTEHAESFSSDLSEPASEDENDPNEENDPIVHSFGPFGANLSNRLASFSTRSPKVFQGVDSRRSSGEASSLRSGTSTEPLKPSNPSSLQASPKAPQRDSKPETTVPTLPVEQIATIANHVVNQLAFSRLASNPLSGIMGNLPAEEKKGLTKDILRSIIEATACIGVIRRQGKDAAGKPLESEYYYVPEHDTDEQRRFAVTDSLRKPSLRACRKQHKQYYWKRPKTP